MSRSAITGLIRTKNVLVDGLAVKSSCRVRSGQRISVNIPPPEPSLLKPEKIDFPILHEDEYLLVISKPPGLVVHPAAGHAGGTLVNGLLYHCKSLPENDERPGIVHRLDKDTSGIMLVARTDSVLRTLAKAFKARAIKKVYHALLVRRPVGKEGVISMPVGRHPVHRKKMAVREKDGRSAVTRWEVLEEFTGGLTFVRLRPETGRTHQIRVHMAHLGCPVAGDELYGGILKKNKEIKINRQYLHASSIEFIHPGTGHLESFSAPLWPDIKHTLDLLRQDNKLE